MSDNFLLNIAIMLFTGLLFSRLAKLVHFPNVTGFLIGGLLIGPALPNLLGISDKFPGIISGDSLKSVELLCEVALVFIAFTIGSEFKLSHFKKIGKKVLIVAIFEAALATVFVFIAMLILKKGLPFALVISAIAAATAPAATIMVVKQYKAKGTVTETLLSVVALDDAVAIIIFGFNFTLACNLASDGASVGVMSFIMPFIEIAASLAIGVVGGFVLVLMCKWFKSRGNRLCILIAILFTSLAAITLLNKEFDINLSSLLTATMIGAIFINLSANTASINEVTERFTPPVFMLFFVISGAELDLSALTTVGLLGIVYVVVRVVGKYIGAFTGAKLCQMEPNVQKYLGVCLFPQAGVALGLSLIAVRNFGEIGLQIRTIILCATIIYEMIGPVLVKMALRKAGDIQPISDNMRNTVQA